MGQRASAGLRDASRGLIERRRDLVERAAAGDGAINALQTHIDRSCLDLMARDPPVGEADLLFITVAMKVARALERVGDHAVNIAEDAVETFGEASLDVPPDLVWLAAIAEAQLAMSLEALRNRDSSLARRVAQGHDEARQGHSRVIPSLIPRVTVPAKVDGALDLVLVAGNLERVAEHAVHIAEEVLSLTEGRTRARPA